MTTLVHDRFDRRCPHHSCERQIPAHLFACRDHWYTLPKRLRMGIERTWHSEDNDMYRRFVTLATVYWRNNA